MQLQVSFSVLLAGLLTCLSSVEVLATPVNVNEGMITLPLKRHHHAREEIHPLVVRRALPLAKICTKSEYPFSSGTSRMLTAA